MTTLNQVKPVKACFRSTALELVNATNLAKKPFISKYLASNAKEQACLCPFQLLACP
jgi:hypothetical protein